MDTVRKKMTGTFDESTMTWRRKEKKKGGVTIRPNLAMSVRQLSALFGVTLKGKLDSRSYWEKFLKAHANYSAKKQGQQSPLQERIRSLEVLIQQFKEEHRPASVVAMLEAELKEARAVPADDIDHSDGPAIHPEMRPHAELLEASGHLDDFTARLLNSMAPKPIPKHESLRAEIDTFIERHKAKGGKGWFTVRQYLELFFEVTGHIKISEIKLEHYRDFVAGVKGESTKHKWNEGQARWNETTQSNIQLQIHGFLQNLEIEHEGLYFPFIRNKGTRIERPEGEKINWSLEQVKTALKHATGDARLMLLTGLNFGWYTGDVVEFTAKHCDGTHMNKGREKNTGKSNFVASWLVWPETAEVLKYGRPKTTLEEAFKTLRIAHVLPEHSDLRKTVQQWLEDELSIGGEQVARLYRCERAKGNHGKYYSKFTLAQRDMLDDGLRFIHKKLFG